MSVSFKTSPDKSNGKITIGTTDVITLEGDGRVVFKNTSSFAANSITSNKLVETIVPGTYGSSNSIPQITVDASGRISSIKDITLTTDVYTGIHGQVFTSNGVFTVPEGVTTIKVRGCGGGAGGGSFSVPGGNGTATLFGTYCVANGGTGMAGTESTPPSGGTASGGTINLQGSSATDFSYDGTSSNTSPCGGSCGMESYSTLSAMFMGVMGGTPGSGDDTVIVNPVNASGYGNGGSSASGYTPAAGSGAGYFEGYITGLTPGQHINVTVGAAGLRSTSTSGNGSPGICIVEW